MMISVHAVSGIAAKTFFKKSLVRSDRKCKIFALSFFLNIILHGVFDIMPHSHPISSQVDAAAALLLFLLVLAEKKQEKNLFVFCYAGSVAPDVIDLGIFRVLQLGDFKVFPWHFKTVFNFLNSFHTNSCVNMTFNLLTIFVCAALLLKNLFSKNLEMKGETNA